MDGDEGESLKIVHYYDNPLAPDRYAIGIIGGRVGCDKRNGANALGVFQNQLPVVEVHLLLEVGSGLPQGFEGYVQRNAIRGLVAIVVIVATVVSPIVVISPIVVVTAVVVVTTIVAVAISVASIDIALGGYRRDQYQAKSQKCQNPFHTLY